MVLDQQVFDQFKPIAKELGLNQAGVQKLSEFFSQYQAETQTQWVGKVQGWETDAKKDKEIGGDRWDGSIQNARKALDVFGTPELKAAMNEFGMGNHPEVLRVFARIGSAIASDPPTDTGKQPGPAAPSILDTFYGPKST